MMVGVMGWAKLLDRENMIIATKKRTNRVLYFIYSPPPSWKNATAEAAATFRESTPWDMGILTV